MNPQTLTPVRGAVIALSQGTIEGVRYATVRCGDFGVYSNLPDVVKTSEGVQLGKTGWNSDTCTAYYQSNASILHAV